jgi:hypothetical protein
MQNRRDAPQPSPLLESAVQPAAARPACGGGRAKPNLQCVASYVPLNVCAARPPHCELPCAMFTHGVLPSDSSGGSRAVRRAHHAAGASAYAEERGLCSAACVTWRHGAQAEGARARCRRPHLRHRRVVLGELVVLLCILARRSPAPIRADSVGGRRRGCGWHSVPGVVRDGLVGAADKQRHGGFGAAVERRPVQRCPPAGRRRRRRSRRTICRRRQRRRTGRGRRTRFCSWCSRRRARRAASGRSRDGRGAPHRSGRYTHPCARRALQRG